MAKFPKFDKEGFTIAAKSGLRRFAVMAGTLAVMLGLAFLMTVIINAKHGGDIPQGSSTASGSGAEGTPQYAPVPEEDDSTVESSGTGNESTSKELMTDKDGDVLPMFVQLALPENGRVDMAYFDTVTFVGDSLTQGLQMYATGIPNAYYCAYKGISPKAIIDGSTQKRADGTAEIPMDALRDSQPDNIYILLGSNSMYMSDEAILEYYREMIRHMKEHLLDGIGYYVQSIVSVRPDNGSGLDPARIHELNAQLAIMAEEEGVYFLNLNEVLMDSQGYLREEYAAKDGYHMTPDGYAAWTEYLITHTAYHPRNPYIGDYTPPEGA